MPGLIPVPTFADGTLVHQSDLAILCYDIDALAQINLGRAAVDAPSTKPVCKVVLGGGLSVPAGTAGTTVVVAWGRAAVDTDTMFDARFPARITIRTPGWYRIGAQAVWPTGPAGERGLHLLVNGTADPLNVVGSSNEVLAASGSCSQQVIAYEHLGAGATVAAGVFQDTGASLALQPAGVWGTHLTATWDAPY